MRNADVIRGKWPENPGTNFPIAVLPSWPLLDGSRRQDLVSVAIAKAKTSAAAEIDPDFGGGSEVVLLVKVANASRRR
jgi:hypothetical protein